MADVSGDTMLQSAVLEDLSDAVNYRQWLADLVRPHLGEEPLEVGSGLGDYAQSWLPDVEHLTVTEGDTQRLRLLEARFAGQPKVIVRQLLLPTAETGSHTAVAALNVLEHIDDHVGALVSAKRLLRPGGTVALITPAFEVAMSRFDREVGHVRRYTTASMAQALTAAGLEIETLRYVNPIGLISWLVVCKLLHRPPRTGRMLLTYDRMVVPVVRSAERGRRPPFGQSVFAVAKKRSRPHP